MALEQFLERNAHLLFHDAGPFDVARNLEQLGAGIVGLARPRTSLRRGAGFRRDGDALDVVDGRRRAVKADVGGERRLQPRLALLAFETFQHRGFFAADVGAGAVVHEEVESAQPWTLFLPINLAA